MRNGSCRFRDKDPRSELLPKKRLLLRRPSPSKLSFIKLNFSLAILLSRFKNRLGNGTISAAATDVPGKPVGDLLPRGPRIFHEQGFCRLDLPGCAITTLRADVTNERLLQRIQLITPRYSLDGQNRLPMSLKSQVVTRTHRATVD